MRKSFFINFGILLLTNLFAKPLWIVADLWVQRETEEEYGIYFVLFNISMLFSVLLDVGINNFNNRKIAAVPSKFKNYFPKLLSLRLILSVIYCLVLLLVAVILGYTGKNFMYISILGFNQVLLSLILFMRSNFTALQMFKVDSLISITDRLVMLIFIAFIFFTNYYTISIPLFIGIQLLGYLVTLIVAGSILSWKKKVFKLEWNSKFNKLILQKSIPYALIVVLMMAYSYSDSIMLDQMLPNGAWHNMIYAQSFRILMAVNNYAFLISVILLPIFAKLIHQKKEVQSLLKSVGGFMLFSLAVSAIVFHFYAEDIIGFLYSKKVNGILMNSTDLELSAKVFGFLMLSIVPMGVNYTYGALLTAKGEMKILNWIAFFGVILNIVLNLYFIPTQGVLGATLSSVSTQYFCAVLQILLCYKIMKFNIPYKHFLKFIIALVLFTLATFGLHQFTRNFIFMLFLIPVFVALLFVIKVVDVQQIMALIKNRKA
jgi:O-antigen/teichoic acid export membrane protein